MDLNKITASVLVVSHRDDQCRLSPPFDINDLSNSFTSSKRVGKIVFTGGNAPVSGPCEALSQHGYLGIERQVVDAIASFINGDEQDNNEQIRKGD
jgi:hypothetical protein